MSDLSDFKTCIITDHKDNPIKLDIPRTAEWLKAKLSLKTNVADGTILMYHEGRYEPTGNQMIDYVLESSFGSYTNIKDNPILTNRVVEEIKGKIRRSTYVETYQQTSPCLIPTFDADLDIINMSNGYYNWRTGTFTRHQPGYLSRIQVATAYDPRATCPTLDEIIRDILHSHDVPKFYEFVGYCFYRSYVIQKCMLFYGPAGTGKSQLLNMIKNAVGADNCASVTFQDLGGRTASRFATSKLLGKLVNVAGDLDSTSVPEIGKFKMLTSGSDMIGAEFKGKDGFEFTNFSKIIYSGNEMPLVRDKSEAFYRRVEALECPNKFKASDGKLERLSAISDPQELSGLFNKSIGMLPDLLDRGDFTNAMTVAEAKYVYQRSSNTLEVFCDECLQDEMGAYVLKGDMYRAYKSYCIENKLAYIDTQNAFGRAIKKVMGWTKADEGFRPDHRTGKSQRAWLNTRLVWSE